MNEAPKQHDETFSRDEQERKNYGILLELLEKRGLRDGLLHLHHLSGLVRNKLHNLTKGEPDKATLDLMSQAIDEVLGGRIEQGLGEIIEPRIRKFLDEKSEKVGFNLRGIEDRVALKVELESDNYLKNVTDSLVKGAIDEIMSDGQLKEKEFYTAVRAYVNGRIQQMFLKTKMEVSYKSVEESLYRATDGYIDRVTTDLIDEIILKL